MFGTETAQTTCHAICRSYYCALSSLLTLSSSALLPPISRILSQRTSSPVSTSSVTMSGTSRTPSAIANWPSSASPASCLPTVASRRVTLKTRTTSRLCVSPYIITLRRTLYPRHRLLAKITPPCEPARLAPPGWLVRPGGARNRHTAPIALAWPGCVWTCNFPSLHESDGGCARIVYLQVDVHTVLTVLCIAANEN